MLQFLLCALLLVSTAVKAQDAGCQTANALLSALLGSKSAIPCAKPETAGSQSGLPSAAQRSQSADPIQSRVGQSLDTPENLQSVLTAVRARIQKSGTSLGPRMADLCESEMWTARARNLHRVPNSGYSELKNKCAMALEEELDQRQSQQAQTDQVAQQQRQQVKEDASQRADDYERRRLELLADLKAKRRAPENCAQWVLSKGLAAEALGANRIGEVALRAPAGPGGFKGDVTQIEGENLVVRLEKGTYAVVEIGKQTQLYNESRLRVGSKIDLVGTQTGTRMLRRSSGSPEHAAVVLPMCLSEGPTFMDLMPN